MDEERGLLADAGSGQDDQLEEVVGSCDVELQPITPPSTDLDEPDGEPIPDAEIAPLPPIRVRWWKEELAKSEARVSVEKKFQRFITSRHADDSEDSVEEPESNSEEQLAEDKEQSTPEANEKERACSKAFFKEAYKRSEGKAREARAWWLSTPHQVLRHLLYIFSYYSRWLFGRCGAVFYQFINLMVAMHFTVTLTSKTGFLPYWTYNFIRVSEPWRRKTSLLIMLYFCVVNFPWRLFIATTAKAPGEILRGDSDTFDFFLFFIFLMVLFSSRMTRHVLCTYWRFYYQMNRELDEIYPRLEVPPKERQPTGKASKSHEFCGTDRNRAFSDVFSFASANKKTPYYVGLTRRIRGLLGNADKPVNHAGMLLSEDFLLPIDQSGHAYNVKGDPLTADHFIVLIDFDYYIDMNTIFSLGLPVVIYTFNPRVPCYSDKEISFTTLSCQGLSCFSVCVRGGRSVIHPCWDYPDDEMYISKDGIRHAFKVIKRRSGFWETMYFLPINSTVDVVDSGLTRQNWHTGTLAYKTFKNNSGSITTLGAHTCYNVTQRMLEQIAKQVTYALGGEKVTAAQLQLYLAIEDREKLIDEAGKLAKEFVQAINHADRPMILHKQYGPNFVSAMDEIIMKAAEQPAEPTESFKIVAPEPQVDNLVLEAHKPPIVTVLTSPIVAGGNFYMAKGEGPTHAGFQARVIKPSYEAYEDFKDGGVLIKEIAEAALLFIEEQFHPSNFESNKEGAYVEWPLIPLSEKEVFARQQLPSQRADQLRCWNDLEEDLLNANTFPKIESNGKVSDTRIIIDMKGKRKTFAAKYIYPLTELVMSKKWCAPGCKPREIALRMAQYVNFLREKRIPVATTDFNRFDAKYGIGHIVIRMLLLKMYEPTYHGDIDKLLGEMGHFKIRLNFLDRKNTHHGETMPSGHQGTSVFGTVVNAFINWWFLRTQGLDGRYLGVYSGDDGVTACPEGCEEEMARFYRSLGHDLDVSIRREGQTIDFLGRIYSPLVWYQEPNSMIDPRRCLSKIHTSLACTQYQRIDRLLEKMMALTYTDLNTPVIGAMASAYDAAGFLLNWRGARWPTTDIGFDAFKQQSKDVVVSMSYWGAVAVANPQSRFPNDDTEKWMYDVFEDQGLVPHQHHQFFMDKAKELAARPPLKGVRYLSKEWFAAADALFEELKPNPKWVLSRKPMALPEGARVLVQEESGEVERHVSGDGTRYDSDLAPCQTPFIGTRAENLAGKSDGWYKNMLVAAFVAEQYKKTGTRKAPNIIYAGSHGSTDFHSAQLFTDAFEGKVKRGDLFYFDPTYTSQKHGERYKQLRDELSKRVVVRSSISKAQMESHRFPDSRGMIYLDDMHDSSKTSDAAQLAQVVNKIEIMETILLRQEAIPNESSAFAGYALLKVNPFPGKVTLTRKFEVFRIAHPSELRLAFKTCLPGRGGKTDPTEYTFEDFVRLAKTPDIPQLELVVSRVKLASLTDEQAEKLCKGVKTVLQAKPKERPAKKEKKGPKAVPGLKEDGKDEKEQAATGGGQPAKVGKDDHVKPKPVPKQGEGESKGKGKAQAKPKPKSGPSSVTGKGPKTLKATQTASPPCDTGVG